MDLIKYSYDNKVDLIDQIKLIHCIAKVSKAIFPINIPHHFFNVSLCIFLSDVAMSWAVCESNI